MLQARPFLATDYLELNLPRRQVTSVTGTVFLRERGT